MFFCAAFSNTFCSFLSAAGCTFDEDSDPGLCEYRQGQEDDFDWQLIRTYNWLHPTPDLLRGRLQYVLQLRFQMGQTTPLWWSCSIKSLPASDQYVTVNYGLLAIAHSSIMPTCCSGPSYSN